MEVVKIRGRAQALYCSLDVLLDMSGRVGDFEPLGKKIDTTLGSNCLSASAQFRLYQSNPHSHTEELVADVVFLKKIPEQLLVYTSVVDNL